MLRNLLIALSILLVTVSARCVEGSKTLVLYDERLTTINDYSIMFNSMKERKYKLDFVSVANETATVSLFDGDHRLYDNVVVFPLKGKGLNKYLGVKSLLKFSKNGGSMLTISSPDGLADSIRLFLNQLGIYPSPKDYKLTDNFQEKSDSFEVASSRVRNEFIYNSEEDTFLFANSSVALLDNREQVLPVLPAPRTSLCYGKADNIWAAGSQTYMVAAFQALNNGRVTWIGSTELLKDSNSHANGHFVEELVKWTFKEKAVIKITGHGHSHIDGTSYELAPYKIKDVIQYNIGLSQWNGEEWQPYEADDVQLELKMIDPYYRLNLVRGKKENITRWYTTGDFRLPDHHGVFTFQVDYKRAGLTFVSVSDAKAIRHLAHDEYPRSWEITNAGVYLSGIFAVIFAWIIFVIFFVSTSKVSKSINAEKKNN
ncbi:hypothetical protein HG536_0F03140 [Torulaspora globosa]|uniref:Dolichyl-diphosphooligosaccharide--protein glycosyltransferase subunit WBP1 n=1 Tax=Torulaspora globosa TaxID=48254 RepID=A0A7G3ZKF3_9SACH|nr:uncharacterized protein HG536_0F03140 [Torulaspora globosa]QLL33989.1 hypothetical protein HG536_0F03140 [Torulaspora globosa]